MADREFQVVVDGCRRYLRGVNLITTLAVLGSAAVFAMVIAQGIGIQTVGDQISVLLMFLIAVALAMTFRYLVPKMVRIRLRFCRKLLPVARGYAVGPRGRVASILRNGLVVRDFVENRRGGGMGLLFEAFLAADGSVVPPDDSKFLQGAETVAYLWSLGLPRGDPRREVSHDLATRLGSRSVRTDVRRWQDGTHGDAGSPVWLARAWFYDSHWPSKASQVSDASEDILTFLRELPTPMAPS